VKSFQLALAQIDGRLGDPHANLETHLEMIASARKGGADLVVFPELSLTGYMLQDLTGAVAIRADAEDPIFGRLLRASRNINVLVSFVEEDDAHRFFISAAYLSRGAIVHRHRKVYLPTYGLFQDARFFAHGDEIRAFDTPFGRFGILICEDFWHVSAPHRLWLEGAEMMFFLSASPGSGLGAGDRLESAVRVDSMARTYATLFTVFIAQANRVGFEDGLVYWGGSALVAPDGRVQARAPDFERALLQTSVDSESLRRARLRLPLLRDEQAGLLPDPAPRSLKGRTP
jgi:NAD+ synthase (glutamine-hydrolysing)